MVTARRADRLERLASQLDAVAVAGDIGSAAHRQAVASAVAARFGRLDILINNAGMCDDRPLEDQTLDELDTVVQVNLVAVLDLCRLMAPLLFASEHGSVINIASIYGLVASRGPMAAYNSTKAALVGLTRHLAAQWGPRQVRVNALAPGYFPTELTGMLADPGFVAQIESQTLLARAPSIDELEALYYSWHRMLPAMSPATRLWSMVAGPAREEAGDDGKRGRQRERAGPAGGFESGRALALGVRDGRVALKYQVADSEAAG